MTRFRSFSGKTYSPIDPDIPVAERNRTRRRTLAAVKAGRLVRTPCEVCGVERVEAHHIDYRDHLNVRWLCRKHHRAEHKRIADETAFGFKRQNDLWHAQWRAKMVAERAERKALYADRAAADRAKSEERARAELWRWDTASAVLAKGGDAKAVAAATGMSLAGARHLAKRISIGAPSPRRLAAHVDPEEVAKLAAEGLTQKEIGARFGMTQMQMHNFMCSHWITPSRGKPAEYWSGTPRFLLPATGDAA